jgi:hypothetical protein
LESDISTKVLVLASRVRTFKDRLLGSQKQEKERAGPSFLKVIVVSPVIPE